MSKNAFRNVQKLLKGTNGRMTYSMKILADEDGYIDKECPNEECLSKFKVYEQDWKDLFSDEAVYCPFCGHSAPSNSWWTSEQIEQGQRQALQKFSAEFNKALKTDAREFNRSQSHKGIIKMSLKVKGKSTFVDIPAAALDEMEQKIQCDSCGARYEVVGSAFYCPCCGRNSAMLTFNNSIEKVRAKIRCLNTIRVAIASKDDAARTCESLIESSVSDLVVAFQRLCESVYLQLDPDKKLTRNEFQRLDDGDRLWKGLTNKGYEDWITESQYRLLKKCFQQRHALQHQEGIVDQRYIDKSGDVTYAVGQRLIIKEDDVLIYADIVEELGNKILLLLK